MLYLLTRCASCAAPLESGIKQCSRCKTRYCSESCQRDHWRNGHKRICKTIVRGANSLSRSGNAEQHYASNKFNEAATAAVEACAEDLQGQTCYICTEAVNPRTGGLVRGCSCRGTAGIAHMSCLAEQAKLATVKSQPMDQKDYLRKIADWAPWNTCPLCGQEYYGAVRCALGWGCWYTHIATVKYPRDFEDAFLARAMYQLGLALVENDKYQEALGVFDALWWCKTKLMDNETGAMVSIYFAKCLSKLGLESNFWGPSKYPLSGLTIIQLVYYRIKQTFGEDHDLTMLCGLEAGTLLNEEHFVERAANYLAESYAASERVYGVRTTNALMLKLRWRYSEVTYKRHFYGHDDFRESFFITFEGLLINQRDSARILGHEHPTTRGLHALLKLAMNEQLDWCLEDLNSDLKRRGWPKFRL